jgi:hypothetical protein
MQQVEVCNGVGRDDGCKKLKRQDGIGKNDV